LNDFQHASIFLAITIDYALIMNASLEAIERPSLSYCRQASVLLTIPVDYAIIMNILPKPSLAAHQGGNFTDALMNIRP